MRPGYLLSTALAAVAVTALSAGPANAAIASMKAQIAADSAPAVASGNTVSFNIYLPLRNEAGLSSLLAAQQTEGSPLYHKWLTPAQFATQFGPDRATLAKLASHLQAQGLHVDIQTRGLHVSGPASTVNTMLATRLVEARLPSGLHHTVAARSITLPSEIAAAGGEILAFSQHPHEAHTHARNIGKITDNRNGPDGAYWYNDLKQAYQYPAYTTTITTAKGTKARLDGTGTTIALLMSSDALDSDVAAMFAHEKWSTTTGQPAPTLYKHIAVNGGCAVDGAPEACGAFDEASLDVQEAITGAPGAHVELYNIPSLSDDDINAGYTQIVEDNTADVVSASFGGCELLYTAAFNDGTDYTSILKLEHEIFEQGNAQGITFLASSGDGAGLDCPSASYILNGQDGTFIAGVESPASDPNVTGVGGTNVVTSYTKGSFDSTYVSENAWSDPLVPYDDYGVGANLYGGYWGAGGGVSVVFGKPLYQFLTNTGSLTKRTVPDVGMQVGGCPSVISVTPCNGGDQPINGNGNTDRSAVAVAIDGGFYGLIGTSVASPEFSSAVALAVEHYGRLGNINPLLYALGTTQTLFGNNAKLPITVFHHNIPGYNGVRTNAYPSNGGSYNYTVGNGTPLVYRLIGEPNVATAGTPRTATNP